MSVNIYEAEMKLTDVVGRVFYATDPSQQQEKLLAVAGTTDVAFWKLLAADCRAKFTPRMHEEITKAGEKIWVPDQCCEGRELMTVLPNCWMKLSADEQKKKLDKLSVFVKALTGMENLVALHDSHAGKDGEGNVHVHIIIAERMRLPRPETRVAERALFYDERGVRCYKKGQILNNDGQLREGCRIVPKGTVLYIETFGEKLPEMKTKRWLHDMKCHLADWINTELEPDEKREVYDPRGPYLAQLHIPKGASEETRRRLTRWNGLVKRYNKFIREGHISLEEAMHNKTRIALSPNKLEELEAIIGEFFMKKLPNSPNNAPFEKAACRASATPRSGISPMEAEKRMLRELYRRSSIIWRAYRETKDLDEKVRLLAEAKEVSAAIEASRIALGYDEADVHQRKADIYRLAREHEPSSAIQRRAAQAEACAKRSDAYEVMKHAKDHRDYLKGRWEYDERFDEYVRIPGALKKGDPRITEAEEELKAAREAYKCAKREVAACKKANELLNAYKRFALDLAGDASVPDADVERAKDKYLAALRRLETPTPEKVRELTNHLKDLQNSQAIRDEKRKVTEERNKEKDRER